LNDVSRASGYPSLEKSIVIIGVGEVYLQCCPTFPTTDSVSGGACWISRTKITAAAAFHAAMSKAGSGILAPMIRGKLTLLDEDRGY